MFRRKQLDRDLDEELRAYAELVLTEKIRAGVPREETYRDTRPANGRGRADQVKRS